jgi:hypothetical protein
METARPVLWRVAKFALWGSLILGAIAFAHLAWDAYQFSTSGEKPVDDRWRAALSITILGMVAGAVIGALLGAVVGALKRR